MFSPADSRPNRGSRDPWASAREGPFSDFLGHWVPIALAEDLGRSPLRVRRFGRNLVLWSDENGIVRCADDECPHRRASLSGGRVERGRIVCPLHGFSFDGRGQCQGLPCEGPEFRAPERLRLQMFEVRREHGFVWLWFGSPKDDYPELPWFDELRGGVFDIQSLSYAWPVTYDRMVENTLDIAHFPVVHKGALGLAGRRVRINEVRGEDAAFSVDFSFVGEGKRAGREDHLYMDVRFPCLALSKVMPKAFYVVGVTPIDEQNSWFFSRVYQNYVTLPVVGSLVSKLLVYFEKYFVLPDDIRVLRDQAPRGGGAEIYLPSDIAIAKWYKYRKVVARHLKSLPDDFSGSSKSTEKVDRS